MRVPLSADGTLTVRVPSSSDPAVRYLVRRLPGGTWTCECDDHAYRHHECKHIRRVKRRIAELAENVETGGLL